MFACSAVSIWGVIIDHAKLSLPVTQACIDIFCTFDNAVVRDCYSFMGFVHVQYVIDIRTLARMSQLELNNLFQNMAVINCLILKLDGTVLFLALH